MEDYNNPILTPLDTIYDWYRKEEYYIDTFFDMIDQVVDKYFYGFFHPLGQRLIEGQLTPEQLRFLATQEYHYFASTTWWNAMKIAQCDTLEQQQVLHAPFIDELGYNLIKKDGEIAQSLLYLRYGEGVGLKKNDVVNALLVPSVILAVTELRRIACERPQFEFIACSNLVVEKMRPLHYRKLLKTFSTHYSWVPECSLTFFKVHSELDAEHSSIGRKIVESYSYSKRDQDAIFSAILRSISLRLVMYDGIESALNHNQSNQRIGIKVWPNFPREPWPRPKES